MDLRWYPSRGINPRGVWQHRFTPMRESVIRQRNNDEHETEKVPSLVIKRIREAILDETFEPGDRLPEGELAKMFEVSRSPIREALFALQNEGTVTRSLTEGQS